MFHNCNNSKRKAKRRVWWDFLRGKMMGWWWRGYDSQGLWGRYIRRLMCVCVCVCDGRERERERGKEPRKSNTDRERVKERHRKRLWKVEALAIGVTSLKDGSSIIIKMTLSLRHYQPHPSQMDLNWRCDLLQFFLLLSKRFHLSFMYEIGYIGAKSILCMARALLFSGEKIKNLLFLWLNIN